MHATRRARALRVAFRASVGRRSRARAAACRAIGGSSASRAWLRLASHPRALSRISHRRSNVHAAASRAVVRRDTRLRFEFDYFLFYKIDDEVRALALGPRLPRLPLMLAASARHAPSHLPPLRLCSRSPSLRLCSQVVEIGWRKRAGARGSRRRPLEAEAREHRLTHREAGRRSAAAAREQARRSNLPQPPRHPLRPSPPLPQLPTAGRRRRRRPRRGPPRDHGAEPGRASEGRPRGAVGPRRRSRRGQRGSVKGSVRAQCGRVNEDV